MADIDKGIAQIKEDLKKYGNAGFDVTTGMKYSVAYVEDRNTQIQKLQKKKADLQKKLEDLEEEGRKAGANRRGFADCAPLRPNSQTQLPFVSA